MMSNADFFLAGLDTGEDAQDRHWIEREYVGDYFVPVNFEVEQTTTHETSVTFRDGITRKYAVTIRVGGYCPGVTAREIDGNVWSQFYDWRCQVVENLVSQYGPQESFKVI